MFARNFTHLQLVQDNLYLLYSFLLIVFDVEMGDVNFAGNTIEYRNIFLIYKASLSKRSLCLVGLNILKYGTASVPVEATIANHVHLKLHHNRLIFPKIIFAPSPINKQIFS